MISDKKYKKGTAVYDSVYWLLKHYYELKFYNIVSKNEVVKDILDSEENGSYSISDVIIFAEKEESCIRRTREVLNYVQSEYCTELIQLMDRAYELLVERGGHYVIYSEILRKRFMSKNINCRQLEDSYSGYYEQLKHAIEKYSEIFAAVIKKNRRCFDDVHTNEDLVREVEMMQKAVRIHDRSGICYKDTVKLLKSYREIKFSGIQKRIGDSSKDIEDFLCNETGIRDEYGKALDRIEYTALPNSMKRWLYSSMVETTNAYISFVDEAMWRMRWLGRDGREYRRILEILFIDPEWRRRSSEEKLKETGLTTRQFYERRHKAIEMLSKILWGPFGHRHCDSVFYGM